MNTSPMVASTEPAREVTSKLQEFDRLLESLGVATTKLEDRLGPVLNGHVVEDTPNEVVPPGAECEMSARLGSVLLELRKLDKRLVNLNDAIQI